MSISGSFPGHTLEEVVMMNKDSIQNVTSAEVTEVYVISPSLGPGISEGSAVSEKPSTGFPSLLIYLMISSGVTVVLILLVIAFWKFR